jgi:hypothetical protein
MLYLGTGIAQAQAACPAPQQAPWTPLSDQDQSQSQGGGWFLIALIIIVVLTFTCEAAGEVKQTQEPVYDQYDTPDGSGSTCASVESEVVKRFGETDPDHCPLTLDDVSDDVATEVDPGLCASCS